MRKILSTLVTFVFLCGFLPQASSASYVVSPKSFLIPGQSVQGFFDSGSQVAIGRVYNYKLIALGGTLTTKQPNYKWELLNVDGQAMPDLRIDPKTGVVYGAGPTITAGSHKVWVKVTDAAKRSIKFWFLLELPQCNSAKGPLDEGYSPCPEISFTAFNTNRTGYFKPGKKGVEFNMALGAVAGVSPYRFVQSSGKLPAGLRLNPTLGIISGTPKQSGKFPIEWKLIDSNGNTSPVAGTLIINK